MKLIHVSEIDKPSEHTTQIGDMYIFNDGTICQAVLYAHGNQWVGHHVRRDTDKKDYHHGWIKNASKSSLDSNNYANGENWIVLVSMDKAIALPVTYGELEDGMVFRFRNTVDKRVFFYKRKSPFQPKMVNSEIPEPCQGNIKDDASVEILWTPKHALTLAPLHDGKTALWCYSTYNAFMRSKDSEYANDMVKLSDKMTPAQVEAARAVRSMELLALREESEQKEHMRITKDEDIDLWYVSARL